MTVAKLNENSFWNLIYETERNNDWLYPAPNQIKPLKKNQVVPELIDRQSSAQDEFMQAVKAELLSANFNKN